MTIVEGELNQLKQHRIALIGCGPRGIHLIAEMTSNKERAKLVAIADPREDRWKPYRGLLGLPPSSCFGDYKDLLANYKELGVDAAVIATNVATHAEVASACIEAGIPIFLEKPIL